jgi:hypothetical protein
MVVLSARLNVYAGLWVIIDLAFLLLSIVWKQRRLAGPTRIRADALR